MAGTDRGRATHFGPGPAIVLVEPQLGENIGAAARAMLNCGLTELRLVNPREAWPNDKARAMASGADTVLEAATLHATLDDALADRQFVLATTARTHELLKDVYTPTGAAAELRARVAAGQRTALVFGRERNGLTTAEVTRADAILTVPLNPGFASLNLGQAVLLVGYAWFQAADPTPERVLPLGDAVPADKRQFELLMQHLEEKLDRGGFFTSPEQRPSMVRNLRAAFARMAPTEQEVRTLHGALVALSGKWR